MPRLLLTLLLSLLLSGMQLESLRHAYAHLPVAPTQDVVAHAPAAVDACAECALLAGGANALPLAVHPPAAVRQSRDRVATAFASRTVAAPIHFDSRGPPTLL